MFIIGILLTFFLLPLSYCLGCCVLSHSLCAWDRIVLWQAGHSKKQQLPQPDAAALEQRESLRRRNMELLDSPEGALQCFCFGLLLVLLFSLFLGCLGFSFNLITAGVLFIGGLCIAPAWEHLSRAARMAWVGAATVPFGVWLFFQAVIGTSLIGFTKNGIVTPWPNNYGDFAWHVGMISSFVFGHNFPPEYHIFPGETLSYPFLINLWTALLWWTAPNPWMLSVLFFFQWMVCWVVIYAALRGNRNYLLPWALLFAGGSSFILYRFHPMVKSFADMGGHAHQLLDKGFPWSPFLTTVWVTQRPAMLGAAVLLAGLAVFFRFVLGASTDEERRKGLIVFALPLSLSVLSHTHLFLVCFLFASITVGLSIFSRQWFVALSTLGLFALLLLPSFSALPFLWGKKGVLSVVDGWMPYRWVAMTGALGVVVNSCVLWLMNADSLFIVALMIGLLLPKRREFYVLFVLFVLGNFIRTAIWEWDQIKIFLGLLMIFFSIWAHAHLRFPELDTILRKVQVCCMIFMIPALSEFSESYLRRFQTSTIYTEADLRAAADLRQLTAADSVIAAAPDHNSPVTLSGRRLYAGYAGTLSSHGLKYDERAAVLKDYNQVTTCRTSGVEAPLPGRLCPQYLLWTDREKRYWPGVNPAIDPHLRKTPSQFIYEILG